MRVGIVTCEVLPEADPDQELLLGALREAGHAAELLAWNGDGDPGAFDVSIVRSTWDYYHDPEAFRAWIERAGRATRLLNPPGVLLWNMEKGYLRKLEAAGVAIVPTAWCGRGESMDLAGQMDAREWDEVVVKPRVSAASWRTRRFVRERAGDGQRFLDELAADRDAMVQVFLRSVEREGSEERSLVWIDGELTHVIRKSARFDDEEERVSAGLEATDDERALCERVLNAMPFDPGDLLYARVDVMEDDAGRTVLSELELLEPSLFLLQSRAALERLVAGIGQRERRRDCVGD